MKHLTAWFGIAVAALLCIPQALARPMEFFEQYDLSELRYVGLRTQACDGFFRNLGIVLDPWGYQHHVRLDTYMGFNFGRVTQINATYIEVTELLQDARGEWFERPVVLPLMDRQGSPARHRVWGQLEIDRALDSLGQDDEGKKLKKQLVLCRELYGKDDERLACFDRAVGRWPPYL